MIRARTSTAVVAGELALALGASLAAVRQLPARVPLHFDLAGHPNRFGSRFEALGMMPLLLAGLLLATVFAASRTRELELRDRLAATLALTGALFAGIHIMILALAAGATFDVLRAAAFGLAGMTAGLGFLLPGTPPNRWFGIRTPATFASAAAWSTIHEAVGRRYRRLGVFGIMLAVLPLPGIVLLPLVIVAMTVAPLWPVRARS